MKPFLIELLRFTSNLLNFSLRQLLVVVRVGLEFLASLLVVIHTSSFSEVLLVFRAQQGYRARQVYLSSVRV
jgi:hypothetical protein